jgi:hypothetical protein
VANNLPYERLGDGFLFSLRDEVKMHVKWSTARKVTVELWRKETLMPPDTGDLNTFNFRKKLATEAKIAFAEGGKDAVPNILEDIGNVALAMNTTIEDEEDENKGKTLWDILMKDGPLEKMIRYAKEGGEYFHNAEQEAYATVKVAAGHEEIYPLASRRFTLWLRREFWRREKMRLEEDDGKRDQEPAIFPTRALTDVVSHFESIALFEGREEEVATRVAQSGGLIYIDLGDAAWRAVEISVDGWRVISSSDVPVRFVRAKGMLPLPEPVEGSSLDLEILRSLLNIGNSEQGERNWRLICAWLVQAFSPTGPYPVLTVRGPQGSAKSTAQKILRNIVDPSSVPLRSAPQDEHNLYIDATSGWVIALDNMGSLPPWLSDALCRLATGGGFSTRRLYTDQDQILFSALRPVALNGIGDVIARPDLLDRALIINLPPIPREERKLERVLETEVEQIKPQVLGALFSAIAEGLSKRDSVFLDSKPRMADFAVWGVATEQALGGAEGGFMAAYDASQDEAIETALESWPIVEQLWTFAKAFRGEENAWVGSPTELLHKLNDRVDDDALKRSKDWPKQPNKLSEQINRLAPSLVEVGVFVRRSGSHKGGRKLRVFYEEPAE